MKFLLGSTILAFLLSPAVRGQWTGDVRLTNASESSHPGSNNARSLEARGDSVFTVWSDNRDGNSEIYFKRSVDAGATWESDRRLTDDPAISSLPGILVQDTIVHVMWFDTRDGANNFEIYYKRSADAGVTWGPDTRLTFDDAFSWYQSAAATGSNLHVVWRESRAGNYEIFYKRSSDYGLTWGADTNLTQAPGSSETPCIAAFGPMLHVLWFDNRDGGAYEIYYKRSTDHGSSWEPDVRLTNDAGVSFGPCAAAKDSLVHVVWQDSRDGNWELYYKRSADRGLTWSADVRLTNALQTTESPSLVVSGPNVHVVWWDNRDGNYEIYYKVSTDLGSTWLPDVRLTNDGSWSQFPHIADADSTLHVVWLDGRAGNDEIYYKQNPTGNTAVSEIPGRDITRAPGAGGPTLFAGPIILPWDKSCRVFDVTGRQVNVNRMDPGVYFIEVEGETIQKIIKVK